MSDRRHSTRPALPEGYQYGDARPRNVMLTRDALNDLIRKCFSPEWRQHTDAYADAMRRINAINSQNAESWRAPQPLSDEEFREKYLRPAVEHDPQGAADLIDRWRAPHENAAAQLNRQARSDEGAFRVGVPNLQVGPTYKAQRTGEETI